MVEQSATRKLFAAIGELREDIKSLEARCQTIEDQTGEGVFLLGQLIGKIAIRTSNGDQEWLRQIVKEIQIEFSMRGIDPEPYLTPATSAMHLEDRE